MGNSTTTLQNVYDWAKAKGIPVPTDQPGGYGTRLALKIGNDVLSAIIAERFNWKFNRAIAPSFLTNSYQQDYPQIGIVDIGWLEEADKVDINNTAIPKPLNVPGMTVVRQLSRTSQCLWPVNQLCWMYNKDLSYGVWPGPGVAFNPLIGSVIKQNPVMSMQDTNGNFLIVTQAGTTATAGGLYCYAVSGNSPSANYWLTNIPSWLHVGTLVTVICSDARFNISTPTAVAVVDTVGKFITINSGIANIAYETVSGYVTGPSATPAVPPLLPAGAAEGTVYQDGSVVWTVVGPMSQGFRVFPLPGATGPVYQITPYYQQLLQKMTALGSVINPIPDDYSYLFQMGVEIMCRQASTNPAERAEGMKAWPLWLAAMVEMRKQGNREVDAYGAFPADSVVESVYGPWRGLRNPNDPSQPY
jgi:hypothetical protein